MDRCIDEDCIGSITPIRKPTFRDSTDEEKEINPSINKTPHVVERAIEPEDVADLPYRLLAAAENSDRYDLGHYRPLLLHHR
ncbi:hypothetical protein CIK64_15340 [Brevibacterium aurantiacum]|uniref:Uncharacterized protein n=1 Tax=Brevibacterium aurantiacum TaxID=273384 RepID=A0A2A3Z1W0_BREAU|nr:hypothetical protein CIK64_15340 [Brevibacterium aurantiacum]